MSKKRPNSIKQLEAFLSDFSDFEQPKVALEQYATPVHIAAIMLNTIDQVYDDLRDKLVADLGCGTGILSAGSYYCGAAMVVGFDVDLDALQIARDNVSQAFGDDDSSNESGSDAPIVSERLDFVQIDLSKNQNNTLNINRTFDTVIMNPPFGTKHNAGLDMIFLKQAIDLATGAVYSLHKTSTRNVSILTTNADECSRKHTNHRCISPSSLYNGNVNSGPSTVSPLRRYATTWIRHTSFTNGKALTLM